MSAAHLLALDLGTTGVRALVVREDGAVRARAWRPVATHFPAPGRVEQDARDWWAQGVAAMEEALARAGLGARDLAGLGVVTERATALAFDAVTGEPLGPAIGWQDQRTAPRVAELRAEGFPVSTMASATKFEWLLKLPTVAGAARAGRLRLATPDAWLLHRLTGCCATDVGQASCTALWAPTEGWSEAALARLGLDPAWLPRLVPSAAVVGETQQLGAPVAVASRAGDQQAASFAQGVHEPGAAKLTLGTAAMLDVHTGVRPERPPRGAYPLALWELAGGECAFCLEGTVITAGAVLDWMVELGLLEDPAGADAAAERAEGVVFVPALQGLGTPFLDEGARGFFGGLTRGARREHLVHAALEGVAQRCADLCDALAPHAGPLRVDGGLARSRVFVQLLADLCGREIWRAEEAETTALGAAFLAGLAAGVWSTPAEAFACAAPPHRVAPRLAGAERTARRAAWRGILARVTERGKA